MTADLGLWSRSLMARLYQGDQTVTLRSLRDCWLAVWRAVDSRGVWEYAGISWNPGTGRLATVAWGGSTQCLGIADRPEGAPSITQELRVEDCALLLSWLARTITLCGRTLFRLTISTIFIATVLTVVVGVPAGYLSYLDATPLVALSLGMCAYVMPYYFPRRHEPEEQGKET